MAFCSAYSKKILQAVPSHNYKRNANDQKVADPV